MQAKLLPARKPAPALRLQLVRKKPNNITDEAEWFRKNDLNPPFLATSPANEGMGKPLPAFVPQDLQELAIVGAYPQGNILFGVYGQDYGSGSLLVAFDSEKKISRYILDFHNYAGTYEGDPRLHGILYAQESGGVLYVSNDGGGYAKEWGRKNAYLTAIDLKTKTVLWRSQPLVANSRNFLILDQVIVTGYGFTAEPDFLYLLDKKTGQVVQRITLPSAADYILRKGNQVFVRCYDVDLIFAIR
jgi:hypothetical protein